MTLASVAAFGAFCGLPADSRPPGVQTGKAARAGDAMGPLGWDVTGTARLGGASDATILTTVVREIPSLAAIRAFGNPSVMLPRAIALLLASPPIWRGHGHRGS